MTYNRFRAEILPPVKEREVIRDERQRNTLPWDTDLTEYAPFAKDNKLIKIESPTLVIDSEHPVIHGAFSLFPGYAATAVT